MTCKECGRQLPKRAVNRKFRSEHYCVECLRVFIREGHEVNFRFQDIEASLQYTPTSKKPNLEQQEKRMR